MFSKFKVKHYIIYSAFILLLYPLSGIAEELTLRLHCWEGYAKPYAKDFKILIKHKYDIDVNMVISNVSDPDEFWQKARGLKVDLISPAHNIPNSKQWPFIESGVALPINLDNIPNYKYVLPFLKYNRFITNVKGDVFGIPYTMGPYGLAYNADKVKEPKSWNVLWQDDAQRRYTVSKDYPDANTYIAALALGAKYKHIYDSDKLWATVGRVPLKTKVEALAANAFSLWEGTANPKEFGLLRYAATWGYAVSEANKKGLNWKMARPKEGTSLWVDHWLITHAVNKPLKKLIGRISYDKQQFDYQNIIVNNLDEGLENMVSNEAVRTELRQLNNVMEPYQKIDSWLYYFAKDDPTTQYFYLNKELKTFKEMIDKCLNTLEGCVTPKTNNEAQLENAN